MYNFKMMLIDLRYLRNWRKWWKYETNPVYKKDLENAMTYTREGLGYLVSESNKNPKLLESLMLSYVVRKYYKVAKETGVYKVVTGRYKVKA